MVWRIEFSDTARKQLAKLPRDPAKRITRFLRERVAIRDNPRELGTPLKGGQFAHLWRFRVGDYRLIAQIEDDSVTILILKIGHRREVYRPR